MGSHMKKAIFEEQTAKAIEKWQKAARRRRKLQKTDNKMGTINGYVSGETTPSHGASPMHLLHNHKHNSSAAAADIESLSSPTASYYNYHSDTELSEIDVNVNDDQLRSRDLQEQQHGSKNFDFSFGRSRDVDSK